jgi:tRNA G46 methylase TrmB
MDSATAAFGTYPKVIVELGMGDGRLLEDLAKQDSYSLYVGIELSSEHCEEARSRIKLDNVVFLNGSCEEILSGFSDASVDRFVTVLPDPAYIDEKKEAKWQPFYKTLYAKLKIGGTFQLVTEITDELLQPVSDSEYARWRDWLEASFLSLGFALDGEPILGAPRGYSTRCLDLFTGDPERIRIATLNLVKSG